MNEVRKKVVVTGATGHLGYNMVRLLVARGYQVRGAVRDLSSPAAEELKSLNVELVKADVLQPATLKAAFTGCDGLFHLAAVYQFVVENAEEQIIKPACEGVINVMQAAHDAGIKKVVMTSSIAAVGICRKKSEILDERTFNDHAQEPYFYAKTKSERLAWELAAQYGINLVTILPGMILGRGFLHHTPSTRLVDMYLYGKVQVAIPGTQNFVDARDVAEAHLLVYERTDATGRYLTTGHTVNLWDLGQSIRKIRAYGPPLLVQIPGFMSWSIGFLDALNEWMLGEDRYFNKHSLKESVNTHQNYDNAKLRALGWTPRPLIETLSDTIEWIEKHPYMYA